MKLGEWIKHYRTVHEMSMQDMANICGFSKAYIGMLEKGVNPTTKKPVSPTMQTFEKIARATGQDVDSLLKILDDEQLVTIKPKNINLSREETELLDGFKFLSAEGQSILLNILNSLRVTHSGLNNISV